MNNKNPQDLTGMTFDRWKVLGLDCVLKTGHRKWICRCSCGVEKSVYGHFLKSGESKSCGCLQRELARCQGFESFIDMSGKRFGSLSVVGRVGHKNGRIVWGVKCDCGEEFSVRADSLIDGNTVSCGCSKINLARELGRKCIVDLTGKQFGRLVVVGRDRDACHEKGKRVVWLCRCDCGKEHRATSDVLTSKKSRSCGCFKREVTRERMTNPNLTDEERRLSRERRNVPGMSDWRKSVYKKYNYTCVACGDSRGGNLVAHHKESWSTRKDLRLVESNGVTACSSCHKEFHAKYGRGGNTEEQWHEFLIIKSLVSAISNLRTVAHDYGNGDVREV